MQRVHRSAETWTYIPLRDRELPPEQQSVFTLRPLSIVERAQLRDSLTRVASVAGAAISITRTREESLGILVSHIESIRNFPAGAPVAWPMMPEARLEYLDMLHDDDRQEIADELWSHSVLGAPEKNSSAPGPTSSSPSSSAPTSSTTAPTANAIPG